MEIDLSRQRLWLYMDGQKVLDTNIVSGKMTSDRYTPPGIFTLTFKKSPSVLRGEKRSDGSYEYEANVTFWMPFNGGIGMHDSTPIQFKITAETHILIPVHMDVLTV